MNKTRLCLEGNTNYIKITTGNSIKVLNFLNSDSLCDFILSFIYSDSALTFSFISTQNPHFDSKA